ncbi:hypothetical protein GCM10010199_53560 [Dactylosporangium roseum]
MSELLDGPCCPVPVHDVAHVSRTTDNRRGHGSAYTALFHCGIDADLLSDRPANFAVDITT